MGQIVGAFATSHTLGSPEGVEAASERVFQGMRELGVRLRATKPDVMVLITSDHLNNFSVAEPQPFAIGIDATMIPYGDLGLPTEPITGQPDFAEALAAFAAGRGFDLARKSGVRPDHGVMIPAAIIDPQRAIPTVLLYVNTVTEPWPTPDACWDLGGLLAEFVAARPANERVALLAAGGLSHWVGTPEEGQVNVAWDNAFLERLVSGDGEGLAKMTNAEIRRVAGNGGLEVNAWLTVAGAVRGAKGELIFYEAIPDWATGMGGVELAVA
jgi:2'-aminobiphenyl-2,3-diol 1,2-dioxygenase large subunit